MKAKELALIALALLVAVWGIIYLVYFKESLSYPDMMARSSFDVYKIHKEKIPPSKGWFQEDGQTYYYEKRKRLTGWQEIEDLSYFFDEESGQLAKGWLDLEGKTYYLDPETGVRKTGFLDLNSKNYYLDEASGQLIRNQWLMIDGSDYYLQDDGSLAKGKLSIKTGDYYFDEESGELLVDLNKPVISLTFDDGPTPLTDELLDILADQGVKASFFFQGVAIPGNEAQVKRVYEEGHSIGNHSYSHPNFTKLEEDEIKKEVADTDRLIEGIIGVKPQWFRSPYGETNDYVRSIVGKPTIHWNVTSEDWNGLSEKEIKETVLYYALDGGIVLLHDTYETTIKAMEQLIPELKKKGYQMVNLETLFKVRGVEAQDDGIYYGL